MNSLDWWQLASRLDSEVEGVLRATEPTEWDENHISFLLVQRLRTALRQVDTVKGPASLLRIAAETYKTSGTPERTHGDIAVIVNHTFVGGRELRGCGFYEAKLEGHDRTYPAFKLRQLRRLATSTPRLALLLYNRSGQRASRESLFPWSDPYARPHDSRFENTACMSCVGANLVIGMGNLQHAVQSYGESFGAHFVSRFLAGRDLDFSRSPRDAIARWLAATRRAAPTVIVIAISHGSEAPLNTALELSDYGIVPEDPLGSTPAAALPTTTSQPHDWKLLSLDERVPVRRRGP